MFRAHPWFAQFLLATVTMHAATFAARPLVSYRALELGAGPGMIGLLVAFSSIGPLLLAVPIGRLVDRRLAGWLVPVGAALSVLAILLVERAGAVWVVALGVGLLGTSHMVNAVAVQGITAQVFAETGLDRAYGWFAVAASIGQFLGPLGAGLGAGLAGDGRAAQTGAGLLVALVLAAVGLAGTLWVRYPTPVDRGGKATTDRRMGTWAVARVSGMPQVIYVSVAVLAVIDLLSYFLPVFAEQRGVSVGMVSLLLALRAVAATASRLLLPRMLRGTSHGRLLVRSMLAASVGLGLLPVSGNELWLAAIMVVVGFHLGLGFPLTLTLVARIATADTKATALALRLVGTRIGQVTIPAMMGAMAGVVGIGGVFVVLAAFLGSACVVVAKPAGNML